jgi:hypothetical protein
LCVGRGYPIDSNELGLKLGEAIASSPNIDTIDMGGSVMGDQGAEGFILALYNNENVDTLFLGANKLTSATAFSIRDMLKHNNRLRRLDLGYNDIQNDGTIAIAEGLKFHCQLEWLVLEANEISDAGISVLAASIRDNLCYPNGLMRLHIGGNNILIEGAKALAAALQVDPALQVLDLGFNGIQDEGAKAIMDSLRYNVNLRLLDMESNYLTYNNWHTLSNGGRMVLETIVLRGNMINVESIILLLEVCHSLRNLDIGFALLPTNAVSQLGMILQKNYYIRQVKLDGNSVTKDNAVSLIDAIIYRSCLNRPLEIVSDVMNLNRIATLSPRACDGIVLVDGVLMYNE